MLNFTDEVRLSRVNNKRKEKIDRSTIIVKIKNHEVEFYNGLRHRNSETGYCFTIKC